ncbi:MAG: NAD(P)/FAD-dependent oxidoreductase [Rickettsiales bacterium]|nr:NAD(P)/FAD-dependent oxidoreductase [Rickettsiales bacterium]
MSQEIHVVGGGLVGSLAAVMLGNEGFQVKLYERRPDMRKVDIAAGRSINLVLTSRGIQALERVGLKEKAMELAIPVSARMLHDVEGQTNRVPYGQHEGEVINSVSRGLLNKLLLEAADAHDNVEVLFHRTCTDYDIKAKTLTFHNDQTNASETVPVERAMGTDGAFSAMRKAMLNQVVNFDYSQNFLSHGYKELVIAANVDGSHPIDPNALHIWPRKDFMFMALANLDGSFTCTLYMAHEGENSFDSLKTEQEVEGFFQQYFPDALRMMPDLKQEYFENHAGSMVTVKCFPWRVGEQSILLGDSSHAIVPFFGQGMNSGFEDCFELGRLLDKHGSHLDWDALFDELQYIRKPNTDAIADMALENFVEMSETTADPKFQLKKEIGFELEKRYEGKFIPRYSMVVFHPEISYSEAQHRGAIQFEILEELSDGIESVEQVDWAKAARLIVKLEV